MLGKLPSLHLPVFSFCLAWLQDQLPAWSSLHSHVYWFRAHSGDRVHAHGCAPNLPSKFLALLVRAGALGYVPAWLRAASHGTARTALLAANRHTESVLLCAIKSDPQY